MSKKETAKATGTAGKVKVQPLDDRVLIEQSEAEEKTTGGILLPDSAKEKPQRGTVIATGPGKLMKDGDRAPLDVKVGDTVFYGKYSGTEIDYGSDKFVVCRESDILAVVTE